MHQSCQSSLLLAGSDAHATDQGITGKKLLLKAGKIVLLSKDASISIAGSDPVNGADSSVSFNDGSGPVTFTLPASLWSTNGSGTLFKYKNASAPGGPSAVKIAKVKPGFLKVVAKGLPFAVPNGAATIDVVLSLDGGTNTYCMTFGGTGDGNKFLVKDAVAGGCTTPGPTATPTATPTITPTATPTGPACVDTYPACDGTCPTAGSCGSFGSTCVCNGGECVGGVAPPTCGGTCPAQYECVPFPATCECFEPVCGDGLKFASEECDPPGNTTWCPGAAACNADCTCPPLCPYGGEYVGGFCWFLGAVGASCDATCLAQGLTCNVSGTVNYAGTGGTLANCDAVLDTLLGPGSTSDFNIGYGIGCHSAVGPGRDVGAATTCAIGIAPGARACACQ